MGIIANRPIIDGVRHRECMICHKILPEQKPNFSTNGIDPETGEMSYKAKCADCMREYQQQFRRQISNALVPTDTRIITVHDGLNVQVGWTGDAKYWPVKPLAGLCKRGFTAWSNLYDALTKNARWASVVIPVIMTGADGKRYRMLCLPWEHWPAFWLEFGGDNSQAQSVRETAQRALALVFGDTAESNRAAAEAINDGHVPPRVGGNGVLSLDLDTIRRHREKLQALYDADDRVKHAHSEAEQDRAHAQQLRIEAEQLECEARERKRIAQQAEIEAELRISNAERQQVGIAAELERLLGGDVEYVYDFGRPSDLTPMFVSGKFGETRNLIQKRKNLRSGDTRGDFRIKRPADSGEGVQNEIRRYFNAFGAIRGNDGYEGVPRLRYDRLIDVLKEHEYIEIEWFSRWVSQEIVSEWSSGA